MSIYGRPPPRPLFSIGLVAATQNAMSTLHDLGVLPSEIILRHQHGNWGNLCEDDMKANALALKIGGRILSAYEIRGNRIWVITEADRLTTTILLPEDY